MLIGIFYSQIVESSSLVSVLFREAISHPYISFFHLLVNGFSVTCSIVRFHRITKESDCPEQAPFMWSPQAHKNRPMDTVT